MHVLAYLDEHPVGHAVATTRLPQHRDGPLLRTAYVDAVETPSRHQGEGVGSAVRQRLASAVEDFDIACLETDRVGFYERLGWEEWRGPLGCRSGDDIIPTPDQTGMMILRLPGTPTLDEGELLTVEAHAARIW